MPKRSAACGALLALCLLLCAPLWAAPRIAVLTMGPGADYWSRFGHNAVLVEAEDGSRTSYNYGYFDFEQPGFLRRFLQGRMLYRLVALPYERDLAQYADEGRSVALQWLDLAPAQATAIAEFLAWNALPENADYRYDYYTQNCSTKVRDIVDRAIDGELKRQTHGRSRGLTLRSESLRLSAPDAWMYYGIHLLLTEPTDRPISRWEESYVPQRLHDALMLVRLDDGRPLVASTEKVLPQRIDGAATSEPRFALAALLVGTLLAFTLRTAWRQQGLAGTASRAVIALFWLSSSLAGALMLGLWLGTEHSAAWANRNLLLFPPTSALLLASLSPKLRSQPWPHWLRALVSAHALAWLVALCLYALSVRDQDILEWLCLTAAPMALLLRRSLRSEPTAAG